MNGSLRVLHKIYLVKINDWQVIDLVIVMEKYEFKKLY